MAEDISQNAIFVLVILTLLISVLGTWTVLTQLDGLSAPQGEAPPVKGSGEVSFTLQNPPEPVTTTGQVAFTITEP